MLASRIASFFPGSECTAKNVRFLEQFLDLIIMRVDAVTIEGVGRRHRPVKHQRCALSYRTAL